MEIKNKIRKLRGFSQEDPKIRKQGFALFLAERAKKVSQKSGPSRGLL